MVRDRQASRIQLRGGQLSATQEKAVLMVIQSLRTHVDMPSGRMRPGWLCRDQAICTQTKCRLRHEQQTNG